MTSERQIQAYRRRLEKIVEKGAIGLTAECLGAVASVRGTVSVGRGLPRQDQLVGTLISYTHAQRPGFLTDFFIATDVTLCLACVNQRGQCTERDLRTVTNVTLIDLARNVRGVESRG